MAKIKGFSWITHPPGGKENKEMKVMKRVLASSLCAALILSGAPSAMLGSTGLALFEGLGVAPQKAYAKVVDNSWYTRSSDGSKIYANGVPVIIDVDTGGITMMYHDDDADGILDKGEETFAATLSNAPSVYAGSDTSNTDDLAATSGKITMLGGSVHKLIGSNDGPGEMETSSISVENGTVGAISIHETREVGNVEGGRTYATRGRYAVDKAEININGGTVNNYVRATFDYSYVGECVINIGGNAHIVEDTNGDSVYAGTNGEVRSITINIGDDAKIDGRVSTGLRVLVDDYTLNVESGTIGDAIYAGGQYPEAYANDNLSSFSGAIYSVAKSINISIGKDAKYPGIYGGFQLFPEDVKGIYNTFYGKDDDNQANIDEIITSYGISSDGQIDDTVNIKVLCPPSGIPPPQRLFRRIAGACIPQITEVQPKIKKDQRSINTVYFFRNKSQVFLKNFYKFGTFVNQFLLTIRLGTDTI